MWYLQRYECQAVTESLNLTMMLTLQSEDGSDVIPCERE